MVKIIAGKKKGTKLLVPKYGVRPTSIQKRESVFAILESYFLKINSNLYKDKIFLDLFSGTGSYGLESLSRGCLFCYFYEYSSDVINFLEKNCQKIVEKKFYKIIKENILYTDFSKINEKISIIFIDPPYDFLKLEIILKKILESKIMTKNGIVIIEFAKKTNIKIPDGLKIIDKRIYGTTKILFLKN